jgi:hypothetical protein
MEIPLRAKYLSASAKNTRSTSSTSGVSKKKRKGGAAKVAPTRTRVLVLVDGRRRSWTWR